MNHPASRAPVKAPRSPRTARAAAGCGTPTGSVKVGLVARPAGFCGGEWINAATTDNRNALKLAFARLGVK